MIRNILWNAEGAIIDTYPAITYALSKSLNEMGASVALNEINEFARKPFPFCLANLCKRFSLDHDLLLHRFNETYSTLPLERQCAYPEVAEICTLIHSRGLNVAITAQKRDVFQRFLALHGLSLFFGGIVGEKELAGKPEMVGFLSVLERYNLRAEETMVVSRQEATIQTWRELHVRTYLLGQPASLEPTDLQGGDHDQLHNWLKLQEPNRSSQIEN